jgi:plasmid stability protein
MLFHMSMIQVRNVPERLHRELVKRARRRGVTLTKYIEDILEREVARPPAEEVFELIEASPGVRLGRSAADLIGEERSDRMSH